MERKQLYTQFTTLIEGGKPLIPTMVEYRDMTICTCLSDYSNQDSAYFAISIYGTDLHESIKQYLKELRCTSLREVIDTIDAAYIANESLKTKIDTLIYDTINETIHTLIRQ